MQYIAGRIGQEYNQRKKRKGAFWQDRYHATAIESGDHLWQCLVLVKKQTRQESFSRSIAVGSEAFVADIKKSLGARARGRDIRPINTDSFQLREPKPFYANASSITDK